MGISVFIDHRVLRPRSVKNIYTVPSWRGKGVAMALLREIISYVKKTDARRIWLHATEDGKRLYEKVGFVSTTDEMELIW